MKNFLFFLLGFFLVFGLVGRSYALTCQESCVVRWVNISDTRGNSGGFTATYTPPSTWDDSCSAISPLNWVYIPNGQPYYSVKAGKAYWNGTAWADLSVTFEMYVNSTDLAAWQVGADKITNVGSGAIGGAPNLMTLFPDGCSSLPPDCDPATLPDADGDGVVDNCDSHPQNPDHGKFFYLLAEYYKDGQVVGMAISTDSGKTGAPPGSHLTAGIGNTSATETTQILNIGGDKDPVATVTNPECTMEGWGPCGYQLLDENGQPQGDVQEAPFKWNNDNTPVGDSPARPTNQPVVDPSAAGPPSGTTGSSANTGEYDRYQAEQLNRIGEKIDGTNSRLDEQKGFFSSILEYVEDMYNTIMGDGSEQSTVTGSLANIDAQTEPDYAGANQQFEQNLPGGPTSLTDDGDLPGFFQGLVNDVPQGVKDIFSFELELSNSSSQLVFPAFWVVPESSFDLSTFESHWVAMGNVIFFIAMIGAVMIVSRR